MLTTIFSPIRKGISLLRHNRTDEAVNYFEGLVAQGKHLRDAHINLGRCYFKTGRFGQARSHLLKVLEFPLYPSYSSAILEMTNWRLVSSYDYCNSWHSFSLDGARLAYVSARRDTNGDGRIDALDRGGIYTFDLDSGKEKQVVSEEYYNIMPVFSPDGATLAYLSARENPGQKAAVPANHRLFLQDLATGEETQLLDEKYRVKHLSFSPDGKYLYYSCWVPGIKNGGIYRMDIATRAMENIVSGYYENTFPSLSPLGDRLAFSSWRRDTNGDGRIDIKDNSGIYVKDLVSGDESPVAPDSFNNMFPVFSPDNRSVLYLSARRDTNGDGTLTSHDNAGIYLSDITRKRTRCVVDDGSFNKFPSFTPDGGKIVFTANWRNSRRGAEDFFENKGVYVADIRRRTVRQLVSDKYYGSRAAVVSPRGDSVAYVSWAKHTNRGLYIAALDRLPSKEELRGLIENNIVAKSGERKE